MWGLASAQPLEADMTPLLEASCLQCHGRRTRPDAAIVTNALTVLKGALIEANLAVRGGQRTPLRRPTRLQYGYTIQDLLGIDEAVAKRLSQALPAEADSGGFDSGRPFIEAIRVPLRAILSAPPFLYHTGDPGRLDVADGPPH